MSFTLKSKDFILTLDLRVFESDIQHPCNAAMDVEVVSGGFSGKAVMDINIREFAKFAVDLYGIYDALSGEAKISEPYGLHMYIAARGDGRGHIRWNGMLCSNGQKLEFEGEVDQADIRDFCRGLKTAYEGYLS